MTFDRDAFLALGETDVEYRTWGAVERVERYLCLFFVFSEQHFPI